MNHSAIKYEITLSLQRPKCVHIAGPFKGGVHDLEMFRQGGLKEKLIEMNKTIWGDRDIKLCLADQGYHSKKFPDDNELFAFPNGFDSKELNNFKSCGRLHHETFNG